MVGDEVGRKGEMSIVGNGDGGGGVVDMVGEMWNSVGMGLDDFFLVRFLVYLSMD